MTGPAARPEAAAPAPSPASLGGTTPRDTSLPRTSPDGMESNGVCSGRRDAGSILSKNLLPPCSRQNHREVAENCETAPSFPPFVSANPSRAVVTPACSPACTFQHVGDALAHKMVMPSKILLDGDGRARVLPRRHVRCDHCDPSGAVPSCQTWSRPCLSSVSDRTSWHPALAVVLCRQVCVQRDSGAQG